MTGGQDHSGDAVRQLVAEIQQRADAAPEWTGGPDWAFHALNDRARLVAALTAVLDACTRLEQHAVRDATDYAHGAAHGARVINRAVAAALEEQP